MPDFPISRISKKDSRIILDSIVMKLPVPQNIVKFYNISEKLKTLQENYYIELEKLKLKNKIYMPRNLPFYKLIKNINPQFSWKITKNNNDIRVYLDSPKINNQPLSILSLLLHRFDAKNSSKLQEKYKCASSLPMDVANKLYKLLEDHQFVFPKEVYMEEIVQMLKRGLEGTEINIVSPVCPDYGHIKISENQYKYTFSSLNDGVGIVGGNLLKIFPVLRKFFISLGIKVHFNIVGGDFEGFSVETLKSLKITEFEFINRVKKSLEKLKNSFDFKVSTFVFCPLVGSKEEWLQLVDSIHHSFNEDNYGFTTLSQVELKKILTARKSLYSSWFGEREFLMDYMPNLLEQGAEYSAMGQTFIQNFKNPFIVGADHSVMMPFYWFHSRMPILYRKSNYT